MNNLTNDLFTQSMPFVQTLLRSHTEFSAEKRTEIAGICKASFIQLENDLVESTQSMNDSSFKLADTLSSLSLYTTHLKAVQELLQIQITDPSLLSLFNEEGIIAVEALSNQLHHVYQSLIDETEEWEQNPQEVVQQKKKKSVENTLVHLIDLAPQYGQSHLIPVLEERRDFICSQFQPYHLFRDQIIEKKYHRAPDLYDCVLTFAETNLPLAEQILEGVEAFRNSGLSLSEIDEFIRKLQVAVKGGGSLKKDYKELPAKIFSECFQYFKSLISEPSPESLKTHLDSFLSSLKFYSQENRLMILTACHSEHGEIYKKLFFSKIPAPKIKEYLLIETGNEDAYYKLQQQYWNLSDWPEKFFLHYQLNEKELQPILQKILQKNIQGTDKNKIDIIREFPPVLKEALFLLFQQMESQPLENFSQKCMDLISKCLNPQEVKNLASILQEDPKYVEFLEKLPLDFLQPILDQVPDMKRIKFVSQLEFNFQTHFIPLLKSRLAYEESLKMYNRDPSHLKMFIELQDSLGGNISLKNSLDKNTLFYFKQHPQLLKTYCNIPERRLLPKKSNPIASLIQQNREEWIEKIFTLLGNSPDLNDELLFYLSESPDKTLVHLLNQDLSLIKKHQPEFMAIARELIKLSDSKNEVLNTKTYETVVQILFLAHSDSELFKELTKHFSLSHIKEISEFLTEFFLIKNERTQAELKHLIHEGFYDIACLCLKHQLTQKIGINTPSELLAQIIKMYSPETQNQIENTLQFWNASDKQLSYEELNKSQFSILSKLLMVSDANPKLFQVLVPLFSSFPLPEGEKLLQLIDWDFRDVDRFQVFLKEKPEFGWHLLDYLIKNPLNKSELLFSYLPTQPQVIACFRTRDPSQALNQMINEGRQTRNERLSFGVKEGILPTPTKLPGVDLASSTDNLIKLELLLKDAPYEDLTYLKQLSLLEIHNKNSFLVTSLLSFYPDKYENLTFLAMEGYTKQVKRLLQRIEQEDPLSPLTELLLDTPAMEGRWLTAALKLDDKSHRLIEHLCKSKDIGDLEKQMTYLAASGDFETVDQLLNILKEPKKSSQSQALLDWTAQGNLTLVQEICREDTLNMDPVYQEIRACTSSDVQEGLIQLYRNLSENPDMRKIWIKWILEQENQKERLVKLLYLHGQGVKINSLEDVHDLFQNNDPKVKLNTALVAIMDNSSFTSLERDLKLQFQFAVSASDLLLNADGSINKGLIEELKKTDFFLENQKKQTTVYSYLDWVFNLFEANGEFSERLVKGTSIPLQGTPAYHFLLETLGKKKEEILSKRDVQVAILSSLLQRPWQSGEVGSCFGTSIVSQSQSTASFLLQSLDDYMELAEKNSLQRTLKQYTTDYPLSNKLKTSLYEHPFAKAREYCISSMGAQQSSFSLRTMTAKAFNCITFFLGSIARENPESYEAVQALQQQFTQDFLEGTLEFYDPSLIWKKENLERLGMDIDIQGGWVLGNKMTCSMIDTQEKFESYLLQVIENLTVNTASPLFQQGVALLKEKILNHDLSTLTLKEKNATPWIYIEGGFANLTGAIYFEQDVRESLNSIKDDDPEDYSSDLKLLHTYASCIGADSKGKISVHCGNHAYSLISEKLLTLNKYQTFDELHAALSQTSNKFAQMTITQAIAEKWVDGICLQLSDKAEKRLRDYLKKQPIPLSNLRDYGWALVDALLRTSSSKNKEMNAEKVESAVLKLSEVKTERPEYIVVGDYNWFENQNACYAAYAISPLTNKLEPYDVYEAGVASPQYMLTRGLGIFSKMAEKPWRPVK